MSAYLHVGLPACLGVLLCLGTFEWVPVCVLMVLLRQASVCLCVCACVSVCIYDSVGTQECRGESQV